MTVTDTTAEHAARLPNRKMGTLGLPESETEIADSLTQSGAPRWPPDLIEQWVTRSCEQQGVPVKITDVRVIEQVRVLLAATHPR